MKIKKATFDELVFDKEKTRLKEISGSINELREELSRQGLPTSKEFITRITAEDGLPAYIRDAHSEYVKKLGFVPLEEKKRIAQAYDKLHADLHPFVDKAQTASYNGIVLNADGSINEKKIEEAAREKATTVYDVEKLENLWAVVEPVLSSTKKLKEYLAENGLRDITEVGYDHLGHTFPPVLSSITEENFQDIIGSNFTIKQ